MSSRAFKRVDAKAIAPLVVQIRGYKTIKDSDLAALFGISLSRLYKRIGGKLWRLQPPAFFSLSSRHARGRPEGRPALAFTQSGVMMVAGLLGDDASLEIGMDIAHAMRAKRRASAHKAVPVRRANDAKKKASYYEARARMMQGRLYDLLKKMRH